MVLVVKVSSVADSQLDEQEPPVDRFQARYWAMRDAEQQLRERRRAAEERVQARLKAACGVYRPAACPGKGKMYLADRLKMKEREGTVPATRRPPPVIGEFRIA